jgi:hypothetical protein
MRRYDQVPRRSKHPLLTGYTRRAPLVEIRYTGLPVVNAVMWKTDGKTIFVMESSDLAYKGIRLSIFEILKWMAF